MRRYEHFEHPGGLVDTDPDPELQIVTVIPSFYEKGLEETLHSVFQTDALHEGKTEVIVVLNESVRAGKEIVLFHDAQYENLLGWNERAGRKDMILHPVRAASIPEKWAGVGFARKIGMDEAARRLLSVDNKAGIIVSLDADVRLEANYYGAIHSVYASNPALRAAGIFFSHRLEEGMHEDQLRAIISYELHLRYHINMQRLAGLPFAYHTVGSAMSVRASAYLAHFGMNKRKAGEDFYFLHKFIKTGFFTDIRDTTVFPSSRISERVPFGTGRMIRRLSHEGFPMLTYHPQSYLFIGQMVALLPEMYTDPVGACQKLPRQLRSYFGSQLEKEIRNIIANTASSQAFQKRFYRWFDAFRCMKFLHFMRQNDYPDQSLDVALPFLFESLDLPYDQFNLLENLRVLRKYDRNKNWP